MLIQTFKTKAIEEDGLLQGIETMNKAEESFVTFGFAVSGNLKFIKNTKLT